LRWADLNFAAIGRESNSGLRQAISCAALLELNSSVRILA
jgi:hypothetical protein